MADGRDDVALPSAGQPEDQQVLPALYEAALVLPAVPVEPALPPVCAGAPANAYRNVPKVFARSWDADACIVHREAQHDILIGFLHKRGLHAHRALVGELHGVAHQVDQDLA